MGVHGVREPANPVRFVHFLFQITPHRLLNLINRSIKITFYRKMLEQYELKTIPTLRVIKPDGSVVVSDARNEIAVSFYDNK